MCVVLHLGGVWPPSCVLLSFVGFFVPPSCPFIPCCSSVAVMTLRRSGHVRAYLSFPMCAGVGIGIHSVSPLVGFPCRRGFRCAFCGGALWRCLARNFLPCIAFVTALCMAIGATAICMAWHVTYLFFGGRCRCCCLCVLFMHDMQYTCAASFFCCDLLRVLRRRRTPYATGLALLGRMVVVYLHRGAVRYILVLSLSTSYRVVLVSLVSSVARHTTYLFVGGRWRCCCLCVVCFGARTSP